MITREDIEEFYEYNILGSKFSEGTPLFVKMIEGRLL